jgi:tetratricopeptide (TPR) repeat protein
MSRYNEAMTAQAFDWDQELPPETEEEVYRALLRALRRKQGFGLVFVQCTVAQSAKIIADLHRDLPQQQTQELHLPAEVATLTDQIAQLWQQQPFDLLLVEGLQASLYGYEDTQRLSGWSSEDIYSYSWRGVPKILNHLNQQRDYLRNHFPARFVFFVPPFVVDYFLQRAADFIDWRSGLFCFPPDPQDIAQETERFLGQSYQHYLTLKPQERIEQILHLKDLQANCPTSERQPEILFKLGLLYAAAQDYENALISWDKALAIQPDDHQALYNKGNALSALGRKQEAIAAYDQALAIQPDDHQALYNKGVALSALGRKQEAIAAYDQTLAIQPDDHQALYNKGVALSDLGRNQEAIAAYDQTLAIQPDDHKALLGKGNALANLGHKQEAIAAYDQALAIQPDYPKALNNKGLALANLGRYPEAIAAYEQALAIQPDYYRAWDNRGDVLMQLERYEEAISSYDRAIHLNAEYRFPWESRAVALMRLGRFEAAHESFDQAIALKPDNAGAVYNKACCYGLQGNVELALASLQQAISLDAKYRQMATTDSDFDAIRADPRFRL